MKINSITGYNTQAQNNSFGAIKTITNIVPPNAYKNKGSKTIEKITQFFNGDKIVGWRRINTDGSYNGTRLYDNGLLIQYSTFNDKIGTTITKKGDKNFFMHVTGKAYKNNGQPNVLTKTAIDKLIVDANKSKNNALSPKEAVDVLKKRFNK